MSLEDAGARNGSVRHRLPYSRAFRVALSLGSGQIFTRNARLRYSQTYDQRQPLTSGHVDNQTTNHPQSSSQPHPQSSSQPHPQSSRQPHPQSSSYPYPQSSSQPHPQSSSEPHPQSSSHPYPQSSSHPHPQSSSHPHPQSSSQTHPQSSSQPHPQSSSHSYPQSSSQPHPQSSSHPHPQSSSHPHPQSSSQPHPQSSSHPHPLFSSQPHPLFSSQPHPLFSNYPHPRFSSHPHHQSSNQPHPQTLNQLHPQTSRRRRLRSSNQQRPQTFIQRRIRFSGQQDPQTSLEAFSIVHNMHRTGAFRTYRTTVEESESYSDTSVDSSDYISSDGSSDSSSDDSSDDSSGDSSDDSSDDSSGDSTDDDVVMEMTVKKSQICPPVSARNESFQPELCAKDAVGECHDPACPLSHFQVCDFCKKPKLHPTNNSERSQHLKDCLFEQSKDKTCEVCLETILQPQSENRFGLQQNCKHCVCFDCLRRWNQNKKMANHKACPTCRTDSGCILSSRYWIEPVEVKGPVMQYVKELLENTVKPNSTVYEIIELIC
ncbi:proteoglycan 4-like isoform X2 [Biomphalaria glabrata]|uniref:Proteoglycan 4-like isoform X2 n=1 Tax=Biomphalaria glabrata TaxID=6526 RepID=A0A9W2YEC9_BIOGL|nr:proteoglycan 4-like isoform X2 [Biomphalaria glabrata]